MVLLNGQGIGFSTAGFGGILGTGDYLVEAVAGAHNDAKVAVKPQTETPNSEPKYATYGEEHTGCHVVFGVMEWTGVCRDIQYGELIEHAQYFGIATV